MDAKLLVSLALAAALSAQDIKFLPVHPGSGYCPREEVDAQANMGSMRGQNFNLVRNEWSPLETLTSFAPDQRKDATAFAVHPVKGDAIPMSSFKGKVVVVGIVGMVCDPSLRLLGELSQLQPKGAAMGFEVLPVHLDTWFNIQALIRKNPIFKDTKLYKAGLGAQGLLNLGPELQSLPTVAILDREGKVMWRWAGYTPGALVKALRMSLKNEMGPLNVEAPKPAKVMSVQNYDPSSIRLQGDVGKK